MGNELIEKRIKFLFGFQRFVQDHELNELIEDTKSGMNMVRLSDLDLEAVSAGSDLEMEGIPEDTNKFMGVCPKCGNYCWQNKVINNTYRCSGCSETYEKKL